MKHKIKLLIMLLSINMFTPIVSMKRDREEIKEESNKKIKLEQSDQENLATLEQLPAELIENILISRMEDIIKNSNILQWVDQVYKFIREISLINHNFRNIINNIIENKLDKKIAKEIFAPEIKINDPALLNYKLQTILEGPYSEEAEKEAAKLIIGGANPNLLLNVIIANKQQMAPILTWIVINNKFTNLINLLVKYQSNINIETVQNPLLWACYKNNLNIAKSLVKNGAIIDAATLFAALSSGNENLFKFLIANISEFNPQIISYALHYFILKYNSIANSIKINITNMVKNSGATDGQININFVQRLIENLSQETLDNTLELLVERADLSIKDKQGLTPLAVAILSKNLPISSRLIKDKRRANYINTLSDDYNNSPLILASRVGFKDIIQMLINNGAIINQQNNEKQTALIAAVRSNNIDILETLINNGANINLQDNLGFTALIYAAKAGNIDMVKILLRNGANPNITNYNITTALMYAAKNGHKEIVQILLKAKVNVNVINSYGVTALISAAINPHEEIIQMLINNGANVNIQDHNGFTLLMYAIDKNHENIIDQILKNRHINIDIQTNKGNTALIIAVNNGNTKIVEKLLLANADINIKNKENKSAKDIAQEKDYQEIVRLINIRESANQS
ncbi:ankyrin repeat domain-containing protein [Candidatus Babela massiliensis]|uniref:Ankyrin repeats containing protein n=1 Tax=Candidatus Babela massiliensis TaxID=673862 RepID=V6DGS6_9BACT|nr:ankyrin repeat domain-containing protein [Candidatus Babela massiliensis]CDK30802.1 Ankyrin repeats containing protein [Candidatus Babela massiliensis]